MLGEPVKRKVEVPLGLHTVVQHVLAQNPTLGPFGWKDGPSSYVPTPDFVKQVAAAAEYIGERGLPERCGSYTLKHLVEEHMHQYVANGALIIAALLAGYTPVRKPGSPNCRFERARAPV